MEGPDEVDVVATADAGATTTAPAPGSTPPAVQSSAPNDRIVVPGPATTADRRRLARDALYRTPWAVRNLAVSLGLLALGLAVLVWWSGPLVLLPPVLFVASLVAGGRVIRWASAEAEPIEYEIWVLPGGVEVVHLWSRVWVPTSEIVRWAVAGRALVLQTNWALLHADARPLPPSAPAEIAELLARLPTSRMSPDPPVAEWPSTPPYERERARFVARLLHGPGVRAATVVNLFVATFVMTFVPSVVGTVGAGTRSSTVLPVTAAVSLLNAVVITSVVLGVGVLQRRVALAKLARGQVYRLHLLDGCLLLSSSFGDAALVPYAAVDRVERRLDHLLLPTADRLLVDVPVTAFAPGGLEALLAAVGPRPLEP